MDIQKTFGPSDLRRPVFSNSLSIQTKRRSYLALHEIEDFADECASVKSSFSTTEPPARVLIQEVFVSLTETVFRLPTCFLAVTSLFQSVSLSRLNAGRNGSCSPYWTVKSRMET